MECILSHKCFITQGDYRHPGIALVFKQGIYWLFAKDSDSKVVWFPFSDALEHCLNIFEVLDPNYSHLCRAARHDRIFEDQTHRIVFVVGSELTEIPPETSLLAVGVNTSEQAFNMADRVGESGSLLVIPTNRRSLSPWVHAEPSITELASPFLISV